MPVIKYRQSVEKLLEKPVILARDFVKLKIKRSYVRRLAELLRKRGRITSVEKGKYATVDDPFLVAPFLTFPSYISMFSALFLRKALMQIPDEIQVVTTARRKKRVVNFRGAELKFFRIKPELFFGYEFIPYEGYRIPVANVEKAIIDLAYFGFEPGGELSGNVDLERLESYLKLVKRKSVIERVKRWLGALGK